MSKDLTQQFDLEAVDAVIAGLTKAQREALITCFSAEWIFYGYETPEAQVLWTVEATLMWPDLILRRLREPSGRHPQFEHRLTPLGLAVRERLSRLSAGETVDG